MTTIPETVYNRFGGISEAPRELLALAWMRGGVTFEDKEVETPKGTLTIPKGHVWGSLNTMSEDIFASVGKRYSWRQMQYTVRRKLGDYVTSTTAFPETRGQYGKIYRLPDEMLDFGGFQVNVTKAFMLFHYGDASDFVMSERVVGELGKAKRGRFSYANEFINYVAMNGMAKPAFTSIGRWKVGQAGDRNAFHNA